MIHRFKAWQALFALAIGITSQGLSGGDVWADQRPYTGRTFALTGENFDIKSIHRSFLTESGLGGHRVELQTSKPVFGAAVTAQIELHNDTSSVRFVLIDATGNEYLLYEVYALLVNELSFSIDNAAEETRLLNSIQPVAIRVELQNASATLQQVSLQTTAPSNRTAIPAERERIKAQQNAEKVKLLNRQIKKKGMKWTAGQTSMSLKWYVEKKRMFKHGTLLPNLQGAEFYTGGVFELKSGKSRTPKPSLSQMVPEFDWRNRHGATDPASPYYDGDDLGTGWATPIKDQKGCSSCFSFAIAGTAEIMANLYYNRHVDFDLAEQYLMECSDSPYTEGQGCGGGDPYKGIEWVVNQGIVDEDCFPYEASNSPTCDDSCTAPQEVLKFADAHGEFDPLTEEEFKKYIIEYGPLLGEIESMFHDLNIMGYRTDDEGEMVFIFKNSWGLDEGENGFSYWKVEMNDFLSISTYIPPAISTSLTDDDVKCLDMDSDGYCNWGIGPKAKTCPDDCPDEPDCDDSRADLGVMLPDGSCEVDTDTSSDGDADSDSDGDGDGDSDGDGDGDADSDADGDSDGDTDGDGDGDGDGDSDGDADEAGDDDDDEETASPDSGGCGCRTVGNGDLPNSLLLRLFSSQNPLLSK